MLDVISGAFATRLPANTRSRITPRREFFGHQEEVLTATQSNVQFIGCVVNQCTPRWAASPFSPLPRRFSLAATTSMIIQRWL